MANTVATTKNKISVSRTEYLRLKKLEKRFGDLLAYLENIMDVRQAREEIKLKKAISQEKLFKQLGF